MVAVGARMETVEPRRSLFGPDYVRLLVLAVTSLAIHAWIISHTAVTARDSVGFARFALGIQSPESAGPPDPRRRILTVIKEQQHPPGYPAAVWFTAKFVRHSVSLPLADSTLLATQVVSAIASLLLVIPMYLLSRMLFGRNVAFVAVLMFQVLPTPARITSDGLTEATYLLGAVTTLALGVRAVRRPSIGFFLMCGIATGLCYLVRPEGLAVGLSVGLVSAWLGLRRKWPRDLALGRLTALFVGLMLVAGPYMVLIGNFSNKPTSANSIKGLPGPLRMMGSTEARGTGGPLFASFWVLPEDAGAVTSVKASVTAALQESIQGMHYFGAALAFFGLFAVRRRIVADPGVGLLATMLGVSFSIAVLVGVRGATVNGIWTHYVSERHVMLVALIGCIFASAGLRELTSYFPSKPGFGRRLAVGLFALLVIISIPPSLKPLHGNREGHKHAGYWLRERFKEFSVREEPVVLIDPFEWAGCYSTFTLHAIPPDSRDAHVRYVVLDNKNHDDDHARLPRMVQARDVAKAGKPVYWWPENVPLQQAKVIVYETVGPSQNEIEGKPFGTP